MIRSTTKINRRAMEEIEKPYEENLTAILQQSGADRKLYERLVTHRISICSTILLPLNVNFSFSCDVIFVFYTLPVPIFVFINMNI